jgi:predicted HTH transcriptional regulator
LNTAEQVDVVREYVRSHGAITNRECRRLLGLSYDETMRLLGAMSKDGVLERVGKASGTRYVLPTPREEDRP